MRLSAVQRGLMACCLTVVPSATPAWAGRYTIEPCTLFSGEQPAAALRHARVPIAALQEEALILTRQSRATEQEVAAFNAKCDADFDEGSPQDVDCATRRPPVAKGLELERATAKAFNHKVMRLLSKTEQRLRRRISMMRGQFRNSARDVQQWQNDADAWLALAGEARDNARERALDTTIDLTLDGIQEVAERGVQLSEGELQRLRDWQSREGQVFPPDVRRPLEDAVRRARTTRDVEQMLTYIYRQHGTAYTWIKAAQA